MASLFSSIVIDVIWCLFMVFLLNQVISFLFDFDPLFELLAYIRYKTKKRNKDKKDDET
jgi:hypothetical protein